VRLGRGVSETQSSGHEAAMEALCVAATEWDRS